MISLGNFSIVWTGKSSTEKYLFMSSAITCKENSKTVLRHSLVVSAGGRLDLMILEVFSNINDSMVHAFVEEGLNEVVSSVFIIYVRESSLLQLIEVREEKLCPGGWLFLTDVLYFPVEFE